jgi:hypothetical protein
MEQWEVDYLMRFARELTELRLRECGHLCIENYAPELLAKLKFAWSDPHGYLFRIHGIGTGR